MIKSMTGFASLTHEDERATIGVTIRAVNHRFLDVQLRLGDELRSSEAALRELLARELTRGRVEARVEVHAAGARAGAVEAGASDGRRRLFSRPESQLNPLS